MRFWHGFQFPKTFKVTQVYFQADKLNQLECEALYRVGGARTQMDEESQMIQR
jgi:hypothetical protein